MAEQIPEWAKAKAHKIADALEERNHYFTNGDVDVIARALVEQMESIITGIRKMKYSDRGEGLEDMDPHCDNHPDYERAMLDEFAEEIIASIRAAAEAREGNG